MGLSRDEDFVVGAGAAPTVQIAPDANPSLGSHALQNPLAVDRPTGLTGATDLFVGTAAAPIKDVLASYAEPDLVVCKEFLVTVEWRGPCYLLHAPGIGRARCR